MADNSKETGKIIIISSPSGGGKSTICRQLQKNNPDWEFSISYTTRAIRDDETDGIEYFFVDEKKFVELEKEKFFAESALVHLSHYGTPSAPIDAAVKNGDVILLDVDVQGAASIKSLYPEALSIFILPPSEKELGKRLKKRGTETEEQLAVRLENAIAEMGRQSEFDYIIINKDINVAVSAADHMIKSWTVGVTQFGRNKPEHASVYKKTNL